MKMPETFIIGDPCLSRFREDPTYINAREVFILFNHINRVIPSDVTAVFLEGVEAERDRYRVKREPTRQRIRDLYQIFNAVEVEGRYQTYAEAFRAFSPGFGISEEALKKRFKRVFG